MDLTTSESQMHSPHDADSDFFRVTPSHHQPLEFLDRVGCMLILAYTTYSCRVTHAATRTYSQPGSLVTWVYSGLRVTWSHVVAHRQAHTHTGSHTNAHSHMATRSHMGAHRLTHRLMLLQVTLVLLPHVAGTPGPHACMLTVVLELGHLYTKSLPLPPALWTSPVHSPPAHIPDPAFREDTAAASAGTFILTGGRPPLDPMPTPWSSQHSPAGPSKQSWRYQRKEDGTEAGPGFWVWVCMHS